MINRIYNYGFLTIITHKNILIFKFKIKPYYYIWIFYGTLLIFLKVHLKKLLN
jgi:hypothetical protein